HPVGQADEGRHHDAEDHDQGVHRGHLVEELGADDLQAGGGQLGADDHAHGRAYDEHHEGEQQVQRADVLVVGREEPALDEPLLMAVVVVVVLGGGMGHGVATSGMRLRGGRGGGRCVRDQAACGAAAGALPSASSTGSAASAGASPDSSAGASGAAGFFEASQRANSSLETASTTIGMNAWSLPHSSAHWPRYTPGVLISVQASLIRPGMASCFQPSAGTHQEWITSSAVITKRTLVSTGSTRRLSTSSR